MKNQDRIKNFCLHDIYGAKKWKHLLLKTIPTVEDETIAVNKYRPFQEIDDERHHWLANNHCSTSLIPQPYPDLKFSTKKGTFLYKTHIASCKPDSEYFHAVSKLYSSTLSQLKAKEITAINFMMPTFTMGLNWLDPETQRLTIKGIARYLRTEFGLQCVVFEDSRLSIKYLLVLLLSLANSGKSVKKLYLWRALKFEDIPFKGPLSDAMYSNNFRPLPPTVHLNGRKFLEELNKVKKITSVSSHPETETLINNEHEAVTEVEEVITDIVNDVLRRTIHSISSISEEEELNSWIQNLIVQTIKIKNSDIAITGSNESQSLHEWSRKLLLGLSTKNSHENSTTTENEEIEYTKETKPTNNNISNNSLTSENNIMTNQIFLKGESLENSKASRKSILQFIEVLSNKHYSDSSLDMIIRNKNCFADKSVQTREESLDRISSKIVSLTHKEVASLLSEKSSSNIEDEQKSDLKEIILSNKVKACLVYLDFYKHCSIPRRISIEIYRIALSSLCYLKTLSINYSYLADDTGKTLMSIGSIVSKTLRNIEILCGVEDIPWKSSERQEPGAMHSIPDIAWKKALEICPKLEVHLVFVSVCTYAEVKWFLSKSMPLVSLYMDSGFPINSVKHRVYNYSSTFSTLATYFAESLESVLFVLWYASSHLDTVYLKFLKEMKTLVSFEMFCCIDNIDTIEKMCKIILEPGSTIIHFKFCLQEDPCHPDVARENIAFIHKKYKDMFEDKGIALSLSTYKT